MTVDQEEHVNGIANRISSRMRYKYALGTEEHDGNLWELPVEKLLDEALNEVIDLGVYLMTLKDKLENYQKVEDRNVS